MDHIDLLSDLPDRIPEPEIPTDVASFHILMNKIGCSSTIFRHLGGINKHLLQGTPPNTFIVDIGGGREDAFSHSDMARRGNELITINHDPTLLDVESNNVSVRVGFDIRNLPLKLARGAPLASTLEQFSERIAIEDLRTQFHLLLQLLERKPVGTYLISQVFPYLPTYVTRRILSFCAHNLCLGGQIAILDRSQHQLQHMLTIQKGRSDGFAEAKTLAEERSDLQCEERFYVPVIEKKLEQRLLAETEQYKKRGDFIEDIHFTRPLYMHIGRGVTVEEHDPSKALTTQDFVERDQSRIKVFGYGLRSLILRKTKV